MKKAVGFDQKILLHHLDYTAREAITTARKDMYTKLNEYLLPDIHGDKSRKNAITMLMKIWYLVPEEHLEIRQQALELFAKSTREERLALHYGMTLLAYPFFRDVVTEIGILSRLQFEVPSQQIYRKIKALYGERRRVEVAISAVLTTLRFWKVLRSQKNGIEVLGKRSLTSTTLKSWLAKVALKASGKQYMPIDLLYSQPMLFPFDFTLYVSELSQDQFDVSRQGVDLVMVGVR